MIVYADILVFLNGIVTYFLLLCVCAVFKFRPKTYRLLLGAVFGGFSAITIFLPKMIFIVEIFVRMIICALQVLIAFSYKNKVRFLKLSLVYICVTYIFGGGVLSLLEIFNLKNVIYLNGVAYFNISPFVLIISTAVVYLFIKFLLLFKKTTKEAEIFSCIVEFKGVCVNFLGVNDTGNSLLDPYFNCPVAIVEEEILKPILELNPKTYLIPISTISGNDTIFAFKPTTFKCFKNNKFITISEITIGISTSKLHSQYGGILSPEIIEFEE